jgi:hypothetical protein
MKTEQLTARITKEQKDFLAEIGEGHVSKGLELVIQKAMMDSIEGCTWPKKIPSFRERLNQVDSLESFSVRIEKNSQDLAKKLADQEKFLLELSKKLEQLTKNSRP